MPNAASSMSATIRPYELSRTAHAPPTAASVPITANVSAMPTSSGNVLRAKDCPCRANTNGSTGRMHGLMIVSAPPRKARVRRRVTAASYRYTTTDITATALAEGVFQGLHDASVPCGVARQLRDRLVE